MSSHLGELDKGLARASILLASSEMTKVKVRGAEQALAWEGSCLPRPFLPGALRVWVCVRLPQLGPWVLCTDCPPGVGRVTPQWKLTQRANSPNPQGTRGGGGARCVEALGSAGSPAPSGSGVSPGVTEGRVSRFAPWVVSGRALPPRSGCQFRSFGGIGTGLWLAAGRQQRAGGFGEAFRQQRAGGDTEQVPARGPAAPFRRADARQPLRCQR